MARKHYLDNIRCSYLSRNIVKVSYNIIKMEEIQMARRQWKNLLKSKDTFMSDRDFLKNDHNYV